MQKVGTDYFVWAEIRAYEMIPMILTVSLLTTNIMPNATLVNALSYSMNAGETLGADLTFSATGSFVYWMVDFGKSTRIKSALVMGQLDWTGNYYTSAGKDWYLTFGNLASPCINPTFYT